MITILADENIPDKLLLALKNSSIKTVSIKNEYRGIEDKDVINLATTFESCIILTEDKDFGEWVFSHQKH